VLALYRKQQHRKHYTINEACAGILVGPSSSGNSIGTNTFMNVTNTTLTGSDSCSPLAQVAGKHHSLRPSPYKSNATK
jgi:hypothetical protein